MEGSAWLAVDGPRLVKANGEPVPLRGVSVGGWLNMENFIIGYPSVESAFRESLGRALGQERAGLLLGSLLDSFFAEEDVAFLAGLGVNAVRIPINYRHFENDMRPREILPEGFARVDRAIELCRAQGIYTVLDLHALPGGKNHHWHSDNRTHRALFWEHRDFQDRAAALWLALAEHYRDEPWVAGYNLVNEPADEEGHRLAAFYRRLEAEVRTVDPRHVLFLDGNSYARDFAGFGPPLPNCVYAVHQYPAPGAARGGPYPGETLGAHYDAGVVAWEFDVLTAYMREHNVPTWVGEFGPVYTGYAEADPGLQRGRRQLLADQLRLYNERGASWSLWTYKDVGVQGLVRVGGETPWMVHTAGARAKKKRLSADSWGSTGEEIQDVMAPLVDRITKEFPSWGPYPSGAKREADLLVRDILFSEALAQDFGASFSGLSDDQLVAMGRSFAFANCTVDEELCDIVRAGLAG
ncbi:MAG: cellulase family glycosylhydrolase [Actinomycetota bacterium]|jgi:aryl-phospho-beta-D-glucosidase BglC (GH1 family)|nr:cellulase family glycosylhydrolase [Actinomycetota bacterium]